MPSPHFGAVMKSWTNRPPQPYAALDRGRGVWHIGAQIRPGAVVWRGIAWTLPEAKIYFERNPARPADADWWVEYLAELGQAAEVVDYIPRGDNEPK